MVADAATAANKSKLGRFQPESFDLRTVIAVRTLYLVNGLSPREIEAQGIGITARQVSNLAHSRGWKRNAAGASQKVSDAVDARAKQAVQEVAEALAAESEELCFSSLNLTREGLSKGGLEGAKQAQAASSTLRNLAAVAKSMRETGSQPEGTTVTNFSLFFATSAKTEPSEKQIIPEVQVTKQVTD